MARSDGRGRPARDMQPITKLTISEVLGFLRALEEAGGEAGAADLAQAVDVHSDRLGPVVDAAAFLGLATSFEGVVTITEAGRRVLHAGLRQRKAILRDFLRDVPVFRDVTEMLRTAGGPVPKSQVLAALASQFGSHHADATFNAVVYWGRYAEILSYDSRLERIASRAPSS